jgi:tetratricopeptide (TPR) repeat protein/aminoglycoside phosphotransferase (APT) family kinase protein
MDTDRNLLFGVLALQADLIDHRRFAEACGAWAARKGTPLADLLVERGWLSPADRGDVEKLLQRKLARHAGDARAGLAEVTTDRVRQSLAGLDDADIQQSLAPATPSLAGPVQPPTTAHVPEGRDRYTLSRLHATGGIGRVWLARDASLGRDVALKELRPERAGQPALWGRFLREAQVTGQLEYPGIVPVYELGRRPEDQAPYYTMRFVRGRTLAEAAHAYHERRRAGLAGPLELRELLMAFVAVCQAVAYAHSRGVLHRDLKPQNVLLGDYGEVVVLDWGLAKVTGPAGADPAADHAPVGVADDGAAGETVQGQVLGTPAYMAPEQAEGRLERLDARTDVYGLGAVLYEVLCGRPPFGGGGTTAVLRRVVHEAPPPPRAAVPAVPRALEAVCLKALAKRPAERYPAALDLAGDVKRWLADEPVAAYRDPLSTRLTRWGRRHRTAAAAAAVAGLALLAGLAAVLVVQAQANAELAAQQEEVEARFALAQKAIATFHTGVSEDALLRNAELKELRAKLLKEAAGFYADLEGLLADKADPRSRKLLADSYAQLGELTEKIGDKGAALALQQKALALRRELAAAPGADVEARLGVANSLGLVGRLLRATGDLTGALAAFEEERDLAAALEAESPTDAVRAALAQGHTYIGTLLQSGLRQSGQALAAFEKAAAIHQMLADAHPGVPAYRCNLALSHHLIGSVLQEMGKESEALAAYAKARDIRQQLAGAHPADTRYQQDLASSHYDIGGVLEQKGQPAEALAAYAKARDIWQKLADAHPDVPEFQYQFAHSHNPIGAVLQDRLGKSGPALAAFEKAVAILQTLADAHPDVPNFRAALASSHFNIGVVLEHTGQPAEALAAHAKARGIRQQLADAHPAVTRYQQDLASSHYNIGVVLEKQGQLAEALAAYAKARDIRQKLADVHPTAPEYQRDVADSLYRFGLVQRRSGRPAAASASFRKAIGILEGLSTLTSQDHYNLACDYALLTGIAAEPGAKMTAAEGQAAADRALATLRRAIAAGYRNLDWMRRDTDLDPLRKRPDFQKMLADLEKDLQASGK